MRPVVILAAGDFPAKGSEGARLLAAAEIVIACDSAAVTFHQRFRRWPDLVIGDLDSFPQARDLLRCVVHDADQNTNDLTKAINWALDEFGYCVRDDLVIVGATGQREDHTIGNIYRALEAGVRVVTDTGIFLPLFGTLTVKTWKDTGISLFTPDLRTKMTSKGLKWPLDGVAFRTPYCATLNRSSAERVTVTSDRPAFLYVANNPAAKRVTVSLGSNQGDRQKYLTQALKALHALPKTRLVAASSVIETKGVDVPEEFAALNFLNQVALFETTLEPLDFSRRMHAIEDRLGRVRTVRNGPRTIDLDLIDYAGIELRLDELTLPHPRAHLRSFVTEPLKELGGCLNARKVVKY